MSTWGCESAGPIGSVGISRSNRIRTDEEKTEQTRILTQRPLERERITREGEAAKYGRSISNFTWGTKRVEDYPSTNRKISLAWAFRF